MFGHCSCWVVVLLNAEQLRVLLFLFGNCNPTSWRIKSVSASDSELKCDAPAHQGEVARVPVGVRLRTVMCCSCQSHGEADLLVPSGTSQPSLPPPPRGGLVVASSHHD